jgi:hypothetical protein
MQHRRRKPHVAAAKGAVAPNAPSAPRCQEAYRQCLPDIQAIKPAELVEIDLDIFDAVSTILMALPRCRELRPLFTMLRGFDLRAFDKLESYALATAHLEISRLLLEGDAASAHQKTPQYEQTLREIAQSLPATGHASLKTSAPSCSLTERALTLLENAHHLRASLEPLTINKHNRDDLADVIEAELHAELLLTFASGAVPEEGQLAHVMDERARAFTLVFNTYENQTRAAIKYLERNQDKLDDWAWQHACRQAADFLAVETAKLGMGLGMGGGEKN